MSIFDNLPHPEHQPEYYEGIVIKRFVAWLIDAVIITLLTLVIIVFTAFTTLLVLGIATTIISLFYRWATISMWSATPGMRMMRVQLRDQNGDRLSGSTAFWHSALFLFLKGMFIPQIVSILMMMATRHGQSLHDAICGVVAINIGEHRELAHAA